MYFTALHSDIDKNRLIQAVLGVSVQDFHAWPESAQEIALPLCKEIYLLRSNPYVSPERVKANTDLRLHQNKARISQKYYKFIQEKLDAFWQEYETWQNFKLEIKKRLGSLLPAENIVDSPQMLVQFSTDATGLLMELPLLAVFPSETDQVLSIVQLANEMNFFIVPRGGGTGLTGGAVPAMRKSVMLSTSRLKSIFSVDAKERTLCAQAGVVTQDAIAEANKHDLLLTVDPSSKYASSLGGNIAENAGGPYAFEYGTTLDNILSYKMVTPKGQLIEVKRKEHPRTKIYPQDTVIFEVMDHEGQLLDTISLSGNEIRTPGLGKDVTNKYLGGLPGVQKEGVDGIITETCLVLHPKLKYSQTLCLEFYGKTMHKAALIIEDLINLRNNIRERSNLVTMSALEEFGSKYVQAIDYKPKSLKYPGLPISVLLIQLNSNNNRVLGEVVWTIVDIAERYHNVDVLVAEDKREEELFWEDRHRLSAISKRTSGFKINEDIVIPLNKIPEFAVFIEELNVYYLALAYANALHKVQELIGNANDEFIAMELDLCSRLMQNQEEEEIKEQDLELQIHFFCMHLRKHYPEKDDILQKMEEELFKYRLEIANHMHAGDGNCHVNLPVHSHNQEMLGLAEDAVDKVFKKVLQLGGEISGEHGIGITKIGYLSQDKIDALQEYKKLVDPAGIFNPEKLLSKDLVVVPYTLSWTQLIQNISHSDLPHKQTIIEQLIHTQICTRCGKCKQVCPMYYPEQGMLYHPRNKNISLVYLLEALFYYKKISGELNADILAQMNELVEHCTACGKCLNICPVKIDSAEVTLNIRSIILDRGEGKTSFKARALEYFTAEPERIPVAAKAAAVGQSIQNTAVNFIPAFWRKRLKNPIFQGPGPRLGFNNIYDILNLNKVTVFSPQKSNQGNSGYGVLFFPGCGAGLFYPDIALAGLFLLLNKGINVIIPNLHKCCGYPLLSAGCLDAFEQNRKRNLEYFQSLVDLTKGFDVSLDFLLTACGTCRAALENYDLDLALSTSPQLMDVAQLVLPGLKYELGEEKASDKLIYHSSCHGAWSNLPSNAAADIYARELQRYLGLEVQISPYCCAESGLGALTSPSVYNELRKRKTSQLQHDLQDKQENENLLVSCPSCKIGLTRILRGQKLDLRVMHTLEYLAAAIGGKHWRSNMLEALQREESTVEGELLHYNKEAVH